MIIMRDNLYPKINELLNGLGANDSELKIKRSLELKDFLKVEIRERKKIKYLGKSEYAII